MRRPVSPPATPPRRLAAARLALAALLAAAAGCATEPEGGRRPPSRRVAFTQGRPLAWRLATVRTDGTELRVLSADGENVSDFAPSPSGDRIAYYVANHLYLVADTGGRATEIGAPLDFLSNVRWSPRGDRILFRNVNEAYVMHPAGAPRFRVVGSAEGDVLALDWSTTGDRLAYVLYNAGFRELVVADADGRRLKGLTPPGVTLNHFVAPAWSPDGHTLAVTDSKEIWLVDIDAGTARPLLPCCGATTAVSAIAAPRWSPDGRFILARAPGLQAVVIRVADGAITGRFPYGYQSVPDWSADGSRVLVTFGIASQVVDTAIASVRPDGTDLQVIYHGPSVRLARWMP